MSLDKMKDIYFKWTAKQENSQISIQFGIFIENILKLNYFGNFSFYLIETYLFLYEIDKVYQIIKIFIDKSNGPFAFTNDFVSYMNYISLETYITNSLTSENISLVIIFLCFQLIFGVLFLIFFKKYKNDDKENSNSRILLILFNVIHLVAQVFPHSFGYLNLMIFTCIINNSSVLSRYWLIFNVFNMIIFNTIYVLYTYLLNDISPVENTYFPSVSNPFFNILTYKKFLMYNIIILEFQFLPSFVIMIYIMLFYGFYIYFFVYKVFIINYAYYRILNFKITFFIYLIFLHFVFTILIDSLSQKVIGILALVMAIFLSIVSAYKIDDIRLKFFYKLNNYNNILSVNFLNDEIYVYYLNSKNKLNYDDVYKHRSICNYYISEDECVCKSINDNLSENHEIIEEFKSKTTFILSKFKKKTGILHLIFLNYLLSKSEINPFLFSFMLRFTAEELEFYSFHFIKRVMDNFKQIFKTYYFTQNSSKLQSNTVSLESLNTMIKYEYLFRIFFKNIKKSLKSCKNFWLEVKNKPIIEKKFLLKGLELADITILISKYYGKLQAIQLDQIKLLKVYSCFIFTVLNDVEYSQILINLIREKLQMMENINKNMYSNFLEKDFGILIISGEAKSLFKIISCNNLAKMALKLQSNYSLKNTNLHYIQPFPFNIFHNHFLMNKFDITSISKEKVLYAIEENGDLIYINVIIIPSINFEGKINFFFSFYRNHCQSLSISALVDFNGSVFAATKDFKSEFKLSINISIFRNIEIFEKTKNIFSQKSPKDLLCINNIFKNFSDENFVSFPCIFDHIEESKRVILNKLDHSNKSINNEFKENINNFKKSSKHQDDQSSKSKDSINDSFNPLNDTNNRSSKNQNQEVCDNNNVVTPEKDYKLSINKKTILSGLFSYYTITVNKLHPQSKFILGEPTEEVQNYNRNSVILSNSHSVAFTSGSPTVNEEIKKSVRISTLMQKFQQNKYTLNSLSKIFKTILLYLLIIFSGILIVKIYFLAFTLYEISNWQKNFEIFDNFLIIKNSYYYIMLNSQTMLNIRSNLTKNDNNLFKNKVYYLNQSIYNDISILEKTLLNLTTINLSGYPSISNLTINPIFNLTSLLDNYAQTTNNYIYSSAFHTILAEMKQLLTNSSISFNPLLKKTKSINPSDDEKTVFFLTMNYLKTFRPNLVMISDGALFDCNYTITVYKNSFQMYIILEVCVYLIVIIFIFMIDLKLYQIHTYLIQIFSEANAELIDFYIERIKIMSNKIFSLSNDDFKNNSVFNKGLINVENKANDLIQMDNIENNHGNVEESRTPLKALKTINLKTKIKNEFGENENESDSVIFKKKTDKGKEKVIWIYFWYFIMGSLFFISFLYIIIIQLYKSNSTITSIKNFFYVYNMISMKLETQYLLIESLPYKFVYNSKNTDFDFDNLFNTYYNKFIMYQNEFDNDSNKKEDFDLYINNLMDNYYSYNFCGYFYNSSPSIELYPEINQSICESTFLNTGLQTFFIKIKNDLMDINYKYMNRNTSIQLINNFMNSDTFDNGSIIMGYYIKEMNLDLMNSGRIYFQSETQNLKSLIIWLYSIFILHFLVFFYFVFIHNFDKFYLYFEKIRIITSIIIKDFVKERSKIREFLEKFY